MNRSQQTQSSKYAIYGAFLIMVGLTIAVLVMAPYDTSKLVKTYVTNTTFHINNDLTIVSVNTLIRDILDTIYNNFYINGTYVINVSSIDASVTVNSSNASYPVIYVNGNNNTSVVAHIQNGTGILVDESNVDFPIISSTAVLSITSITPELTINASDPQNLIASFNGSNIHYIHSISNGIAITVDNTDSLNPIISSLAVLDLIPGTFISIDKTNPQSQIVSLNVTITDGVKSISSGLGISSSTTIDGDVTIINQGVINLTGIYPIVVDSTDPSFPIVEYPLTKLEAPLYITSASYGDPLLLTNQVYGLGYYKTVPNGFWQRGNILNITSDSSYTFMESIALDSNDNVYLTGFSGDQSSYPFTKRTVACGGNGSNSCSITAKSSIDQVWTDGFAVYSTNGGNVESHYMSIDDNNNIYITGYFDGSSNIVFNTTTVSSGTCGTSIICGWCAALDSNMDLKWFQVFPTTSNGNSVGTFIETLGTDTYVFGGQTNDVSIGNCTLSAGNTIFLAKLNANTGVCEWIIPGSFTSGIGLNSFCQMKITSTNEIVVAGIFDNTITLGSFSATCAGSNCIFIAKANSSGSWTQLIVNNTGNFFTDSVVFAYCGMDVDSDGNIFVTGGMSGATQFGSLSLPIGASFFIAKAASNGTWIAVNSASGTSSPLAVGTKMSIDNRGNLYVPGLFKGNMTFGSTSIIYNGGADSLHVGPFLLNITNDLEFVYAKTATAYLQALTRFNYGALQAKASKHTNNVFMLGLTRIITVFDTITIQQQAGASDAQGYWLAATQLTYPPAQIVMLTQSGVFGDTLTATASDVVTGLTGLTSTDFYYYDNVTQTLTTSPTQYLAGYALSTTSMFFDPQPLYIINP